MKNLRKNLKSKKGFTLIELIVVIVILAILMAIMLPSLTGYIDQANQQGALVEARNVYAALQTMNGLQYGQRLTGTSAYFNGDGASVSLTAAGVIKLNQLIGVAANTYNAGTGTGAVSAINRTGNTVIGFKLATASYGVTYVSGQFTID